MGWSEKLLIASHGCGDQSESLPWPVMEAVGLQIISSVLVTYRMDAEKETLRLVK